MSQETINAIILAISAIAASYFGYKGIKYQVDRAKTKRAAHVEVAEQDEAIARYEDNPAKFVKDLFDDNQRLRAEVRRLDDDRRTDRAAVDQALEEVRRIRAELDTLKRDDVRFRDALGRWLGRMFASWGVSEEMPWPPADDLAILKSVLPERGTPG